jgi:hypothetical protein
MEHSLLRLMELRTLSLTMTVDKHVVLVFALVVGIDRSSNFGQQELTIALADIRVCASESLWREYLISFSV